MDIRTSDWGPYSSQLPGISHIGNGRKFSVAVLPGTMSSRHPVVNFQTADGGFEILEALPDLTYYHHLYRTGFDRKLLADVEYFTLSPQAAAIFLRYTNTANRPVNVETVLAMQAEEKDVPPGIFLSSKGHYLDVKDYSRLDSPPVNWHADYRCGTYPDPQAVNGVALYWGTVYRGRAVQWDLPKGLKGNYNLFLRYCLNEPSDTLRVEVAGGAKKITLHNTEDEYAFTRATPLRLDGQTHLTLKYTPSEVPLQLDGLVLLPVGEPAPKVQRNDTSGLLTEIKVNPVTSISTMKAFAAPAKHFGLWSSNARKETSPVGPRRNQLSILTPKNLPDAARLANLANLLGGKFSFANVLCVGNQNTILAPGKTFEEHFILSTAESEKGVLGQLQRQRPGVMRKIASVRAEYRRYAESFRGPKNIGVFAQRLAAQTFSNINYPGVLGAKREQKVRYYTPAKYYGTFYLWDMGMTGVGLSSAAPRQAADLFRQYLPADNRVPFVSWGTTLPCHVFLYWNYYQIHRDRKFLAENFDLAMRMYGFFAGHDPRSATRDPETGLLSNFQYSYNSGGWDDYPAQQWYHKHGQGRVFPTVCTVQTILAAKMLQLAAMELGKQNESRLLTVDISRFESLLYRYHWNEAEGLFSYYDARGDKGKFFAIHGEEANKGLDGLFPLVSGSLRPEHRDRLMRTVMDETRFLTPHGLTTVDMTAGYYRADGYWNGHVWAPPTWFFFRGLLNYGYTSQAVKLAKRTIQAFAKASERQGAIAECVDNVFGDPEHVPYFSGLTAPLLDLMYSLYGNRSVTTGPDVDAVLARRKDKWILNVRCPTYRGMTGLILTLEDNQVYSATFVDSGKRTKLRTDTFGKAALRLKITQPKMTIELRRDSGKP